MHQRWPACHPAVQQCACSCQYPGSHRAGLIDGYIDLVLVTPAARIAQTVVEAMHAALDRPDALPQATQMTLPVEACTAENV